VDPSRFDNAVRSLFSAPSRRGFNRTLLALAAGTVLAPLWYPRNAMGGAAHHHKSKRKNKRKKHPPTQCGPGQQFCPSSQPAKAGSYTACCSTAADPASGNPYEVCTECGCCPYGNTQCCPSAGDALCCQSGYQCSYSVDFTYSACCAPDDKVCFGGCCHAEDVCCTMNDGTPYCCSGAEGLTCKKSNGPTCV
jgi:hypothetical protein